MAVGGRKASSLELGCDFLFDYTCSPCIADGKNKEALKFCVECGEYLCGDCLNNHNRFAKLKEHQVVEPAKYDSERSCPNESDIPTITICCDKHSGKVLDMFCCDHDQVCCAVCLASDHSKCKRNAYIPEITKDCQLSKEYKQQQKEKKKILSQLELIKQNKNKDLASQRRKKGDILKKFKQLREDIIKKVDNLEKRSMELVENRYQQNVSTVEEDSEEIDKMQKIVKTHDDQLKNENDDAQAFVLLKTGKKHVANTKDLMKRLQSPENLSLDFKINKHVSDCFSGIRSFGSLNSEQKEEVDVTETMSKLTVTDNAEEPMKETPTKYDYGVNYSENRYYTPLSLQQRRQMRDRSNDDNASLYSYKVPEYRRPVSSSEYGSSSSYEPKYRKEKQVYSPSTTTTRPSINEGTIITKENLREVIAFLWKDRKIADKYEKQTLVLPILADYAFTKSNKQVWQAKTRLM